jgi:hypothetical protein
MTQYQKIDPEFKAEWVAALRSGRYAQGQGCLRTVDNTFCCLGVACDLIDPGIWTKFSTDMYQHGQRAVYMPSPFERENIGLDFDAATYLSELNDTLKWDFHQIADWIEANL